jgi:hypothetical protein
MTIQIQRLVVVIGRDRHGQPGVELSRACPEWPARFAINPLLTVSGPSVDVRFTRGTDRPAR